MMTGWNQHNWSHNRLKTTKIDATEVAKLVEDATLIPSLDALYLRSQVIPNMGFRSIQSLAGRILIPFVTWARDSRPPFFTCAPRFGDFPAVLSPIRGFTAVPSSAFVRYTGHLILGRHKTPVAVARRVCKYAPSTLCIPDILQLDILGTSQYIFSLISPPDPLDRLVWSVGKERCPTVIRPSLYGIS